MQRQSTAGAHAGLVGAFGTLLGLPKAPAGLVRGAVSPSVQPCSGHQVIVRELG